MQRVVSMLSSVVFGVFLLGCASNLIEMKYTSSIQQGYGFTINAPVIITAHKGDLLAASYIPFIKQALEMRGFNSLYTQGQIPEKSARNIIYVSLVKVMRSYPSSSVQYIPSKMIDRSACFNYDGMYYCREQTYPIITGYTTSLNLFTEYHFIMDWYDNYMKKRILYVDGSIQDGACIYEGIYQDLIQQTISRIDFSRGESYSYSAPLAYYNFSCLISRTKMLGTKK